MNKSQNGATVQVNMLMNFKNCAEDEECPVPDEVRESMLTFHTALLGHCGWPPPPWLLSGFYQMCSHSN